MFPALGPPAHSVISKFQHHHDIPETSLSTYNL